MTTMTGRAKTSEPSVETQGVAFVDGGYCPLEEARLSIFDWGFLRSDACQDTISVWHGLAFRLDDHLERFERSCRRLRLQCPYDRAQLRRIVLESARRAALRDAYVQIIMTRGQPPLGSRDIRLCRNRFMAFCIPYVWIAPPEAQERGLHLIVSRIRRIPRASVDPQVKHYHWLDFEMGLFEAYDRGGETVALTDEAGNVTEGPGFNVFAVRGHRLLTPAEGCLDGMTRRTVLELAADLGIPAAAVPLPAETLPEADEVFLSSTAGGIMPVTRIDGCTIGDGRPGPLTLRLRETYWSRREAGWHGTPL